jgi:pilus assembly protein Flp/PilA
MEKLIKRFLREEDGVTAIEYGLIAGIVAIAIITALNLMGDSLDGIFRRFSTVLDNAAPAAG